MPDARARFTETVDDYRRYRPDYPDALVAWVGEVTAASPPAVVLDLGAGTGISSRRFAAHGYRVIGIEPNDAMRAAAEADGGEGCSYRSGEAAATGLEASSVDLAVGGQAWHWFDLEATFAELERVLRAGRDGWCVAFWNIRTEAPAMVEYDALLQRCSEEYRAVTTGPDTLDALHASGIRQPVSARFPNSQRLDWEGLRGRAWSSSYVVHGLTDPAAFEVGLEALWRAHARDGSISFCYDTLALAWRLP